MFDKWAGVIAIVLAAVVLATAVALTVQSWKTGAEVSKKLSLRVAAVAVPYNNSWTMAVFNLGPAANITGVWTTRGFVPIGEVLERGDGLVLNLADRPYTVQACALSASPFACELVEVAGWMIKPGVTFNASSLASLGVAAVFISKEGCGSALCSFDVNGVIDSSLKYIRLDHGVYEYVIPVLGQSIFEARGCSGLDGAYITYSNFTGSHVIRPGTALYFKVATACPPVTVTVTSTSTVTKTTTVTPTVTVPAGTTTTTTTETVTETTTTTTTTTVPTATVTTTVTTTTTVTEICNTGVNITSNIIDNNTNYWWAKVTVKTCGLSVESDSWRIHIYQSGGKWRAYFYYVARLSNGDTADGIYTGYSACQKKTEYTTSGSYITIECGRQDEK